MDDEEENTEKEFFCNRENETGLHVLCELETGLLTSRPVSRFFKI